MKKRGDCAKARRELRALQRALWESEQRLRLVLAHSLDGALIVDDQFRIIYVNDEVGRIFGYAREEILGQDFRRFIDEESVALVQDRYLRRQRGENTPDRYTFRVVRKDGEQRTVEVKSTVMQTRGGKTQTLAQILDVTDTEIMEENRRRFEERLSALNTHGQSLIMAKSRDEIYALTLDAMEKTLGFTHASFLELNRSILQVAQQRGYPRPLTVELSLATASKGVTVRAVTARTPILIPDTKEDPGYVEGIPGIRSELAVPVETEGRVLGVLNVESKKLGAFDIRDMHLLQILASHAATAIGNLEKREEIERRSGQLASLMRSSTRLMSLTDVRTRLATIAEAIRELGWRRAVISVRDESMEINDLRDIVTAGLTSKEAEFLWENRPPGQVWRERFGPDYTRFKIGEFYHLPWSDPWVRKRFSDTTVPSNLSPEEMVDWDPQDLLYAPLRLADGRIVGVLSMDDPVDGRRPTRESLAPLELFIHQGAVAIENAQLIQNLNVAREQLKADAEMLESKVEERTLQLRRSQEQLLKAQKLAAIGEVASMVGHDLRNPLTGIAGAVYYLKSKAFLKADVKTKEMLKLIEKDIEYSNKIINDLGDYSRELQLELVEVNPKRLMKEASVMVRIPRNIRVRNLMKERPRVKVDIEKMKRVFVNLIRNAVDAMPKGGRLVLRSRETNLGLEITISDNGTGVPDDVLKKIWTPLFTTKAKGMGLGLPICRRIVDAHGGTITMESTVGEGTTFAVTIPLNPKIEGGERIWIQQPESSLLTTTKA
jgi:PAS domain S-box-containing protein